jgi:NAD(P)H-hydrate epimerase
MIAVEQAADQAGHSYQAMMEAAGLGLAGEIQERLGDSSDRRRIVGLVGSGNNGGDALVALDHLHGWGWETTAVLLKAREEADPLIERYQEAGGRILECTAPEACLDLLKKEVLAHDVVLDGVLGTGIQLPVRGDLAALLSGIKELLEAEAGPPLVAAVDCPSGVDCDTGEVDPACIPADLTVTMAAYKHGLLKFPAYNYLGELTLVGIDLPPGLEALETIPREVVEVSAVKTVLPDRPLDAHKGTFGTAVLIAGSGSYPGAAGLAAEGAYKVGAGLVQVGSLSSVRTALAGELPEVTWAPLEDQEGWIAGDPAGRLVEPLERATALLIGPGLGQHPATYHFLQELLEGPGLPPLVVDADGLRLISRMENWPELLPGETVLTPHPGEMAVMTGWSVGEVQADRVAAAEHFAEAWGHIVVLKGAHTVVAAPDGQTRVIAVATPALAKAGTGDVLAGMITGLRAQGSPGFEAAWSAAWLHARAGEVAAGYLGSTAGVLAGDVLDAVVDLLGWVSNL